MNSRIVPSKCGNVFALDRKRICGHRLYRPPLHSRHVRHDTPTSIATRSPTLRVDVDGRLGPRAVMIPPASWPRTSGSRILKMPLAPWL